MIDEKNNQTGNQIEADSSEVVVKPRNVKQVTPLKANASMQDKLKAIQANKINKKDKQQEEEAPTDDEPENDE